MNLFSSAFSYIDREGEKERETEGMYGRSLYSPGLEAGTLLFLHFISQSSVT